MSITHTINVNDLTDQDAVRRAILEIQNNGTSYSLVQDGIEVAKFVPVERKETLDPDALMKKRLEVLERSKVLAKRIAQHWNSDETAVEAITNDRDASDRRLFHGSR